MSDDAPERTLSRFWRAALIGLAGTVAGLGAPGLLSASQMIVCDDPLLVANPVQASAQLGWAIAVDKDEDQKWLAGGANQDNAKAGSVSMYLNPVPGALQAGLKIRPDDLQPNDQFGSSVSISRDWLAVGAPMGNGRVRDSGVVYLFQREETTWVPKAKLDAMDATRGDQFGFSVSLNVTTLVVGAPGNSGRGSRSGSAYVFELQGGVWKQTAKLLVADGRPFDEFGSSVALSGARIVVGAPFADNLQVFRNFGAAYVFTRDGSNGWILRSPDKDKLTADVTFREDNILFGASVAIQGDRIVAGAPGDDLQNQTNSGSAYVFELQGTDWIRQPVLTPADPGQGEQFGTAVQTDGDRVVIGARFDGESVGEEAGAAYLFQKNGGTWQQKQKLRNKNPQQGAAFGQSVAILGEEVFLGGFRYDVGAESDAGAITVCKPGTVVRPQEADLETVSKTDGNEIVDPGQDLTYTITFKNNGPDDVKGAKIIDPFPPALTGVNGLPLTVDLLDKEEKTFHVSAKVRQGARGRFTNKACIAPPDGTIDPMEKNDCKSDTNRIRNPPESVDLALEKSDAPDPVGMGEILMYTLMITNKGPDTATGVTLDETVPPDLIPMGRECSGSSCPLDTLEPDESVTITLKFKIPECYSGPSTVVNTATVRADQRELSPADNTDTEETRIVGGQECVDLVLKKSDDPDPVGVGGILTYKLVIMNEGPDTATGVVLDETVPAELTSMGRDCMGSSCPLDRLEPGERVTIALKFKVPECYSGPSTVVNTATVRADQGELSPADNTDTEETRIVDRKMADLVVEKAGPGSVRCGDPMEYILEVRNPGPDFSCGVVLKDPVPAGLTSPVIPPGCELKANEILCRIGELPPGPSQIFRVSFTVSESAEDESKIVNTATITADTADPTASNNSAMTMAAVTCPPNVFDLSISKTDDLETETVEPGQMLGYMITVANLGNVDVAGATVTDVFPAELTNVRWCRDEGSSPCTPNRAGNIDDMISLHAAGAPVIYRVSGVVATVCTGIVINTASVTGPPGFIDMNPGNNSSTEETEITGTGVKALCEDISGPNLEGGAIAYTFALLNCGPANQADNPGDEFKDILPGGLTLTGASASSGTASTLGNMAMWNGSILAGDKVTITVTATINAGTAGTTICNQASIAFDADGDGINESSGLSDDPGLPGDADPCCFPVLSASAIPALSVSGLLALALLLAVLALVRLRRRPAP